MEEFMERIKENDKVLVKAKIQNKAKKECYFLGTVNKSVYNKKGDPVSLLHIKLDQDDGDKVRRIKLDGIDINEVKKLIIPIDHLFKDKNIKPASIKGECGVNDDNCDGEMGEKEMPEGVSNTTLDVDLKDVDMGKGTDQDPFANPKSEVLLGEVKRNEASEQVIVERDFSDDEEGYRSEDYQDVTGQFQDVTGHGGGKKKKKKNRSRSKKNKKKRKRKNSTKKKN